MEQGADHEPEHRDRRSIDEFLGRHFRPASEPSDADLMLSTNQLFQKLDEHSPGEFYLFEVVQCLRDAGFTERYVGDQFVWLLRSV